MKNATVFAGAEAAQGNLGDTHAMFTRNCLVGLTALVLVVGGFGSEVFAEYVPGFTWNRLADFDLGTQHLSTLGNPNTDSEGSAVWQYESTDAAGDPLGGANPWYEGATSLMVWDSNWYGQWQRWARGDDFGGMVGPDHLQHLFQQGDGDHAPVVRWLNPVSDPFVMTITGTLYVHGDTSGGGFSGIDVVIAHVDHSDNDAVSLLYGSTFAEEDSEQSVAISGVGIEPGDQIILSGRGLRPSTEGYISVRDGGLTFTFSSAPVPGPSCLVALIGIGAMALLIAARRRLRR